MQELGKQMHVSAPDELFSCGLMARIGCLALATAYPDRYAELLAQQTSRLPLSELEQQHIQTDHNEVTAAMMINFGFPRIFVESVYYHEAPEESNFSEGSRPYQIVNQLYLAKKIADFGITEESKCSGCMSELILLGGKNGLNAEAFGTLVDGVMKEWQAWSPIFKIPAIELPPSFIEIVNSAVPHLENNQHASFLRILLAEDDEATQILVKEFLVNNLGHTVFTASDGHQALALALDKLPHIVVTDWLMPVMDGLELTRSLRATDWGKNLYIVMLTSVDDEEDVIEAFDAGVDDYVTKPVNFRSLRARLRAAWHYRQLQESWERDREQLKRFAAELALTNRKLEHYALTDMLTELPNRRSGMETLAEAWSIADRSDLLMAIMLIDIDHFKTINDTYGHSVGDKVLKEIAALFRKAARKGDAFCRFGGEEFLVICQPGNVDAKSAVIFAERLRRMVAAYSIQTDEIRLQITISIGIALKEPATKNENQLINATDKALYAAKNAGRNRVFIALKDRFIPASAQSGNSTDNK